jgi:hypothetical protein
MNSWIALNSRAIMDARDLDRLIYVLKNGRVFNQALYCGRFKYKYDKTKFPRMK